VFAAWTAAMAAGARIAAPSAAATLASMTTCGAWSAAARLIDTAAHRTSAAAAGSAVATTCAAARLVDTAAHRTSAAAAGSGVVSPCAVSLVDSRSTSSPAVLVITANAASRAADR
jgi:hypothetical protein